MTKMKRFSKTLMALITASAMIMICLQICIMNVLACSGPVDTGIGGISDHSGNELRDDSRIFPGGGRVVVPGINVGNDDNDQNGSSGTILIIEREGSNGDTAHIKFDINGDGEIDSLDALNILRYDAGLIDLDAEQFAAADVNGDGTVDLIDAVIIFRYDAGLIDLIMQ